MSAIKDRSVSTAISLFSEPFTKKQAQSALREPVSEELYARILSLVTDLRFTTERMKERQAALCPNLLFSHEISQKQLEQTIVLLDAVAAVINENAREE